MDKTTTQVAKIISFVFNPLIMPSLGLILILFTGTYLSFIPFAGKQLLLTIIFAGTFVLPLCFVPLFLYFKIIKNIEMESPSQRIVPFIITTTLYICTYYVMRKMPVPFINMFILATSLCIFLNTIILIFWKISSHLIGIGGIIGLAAGLIFRLDANIPYIFIALVLIAGLIGASRLKLGAHTPAQVYAGFFLGLFVVGGSLIFI
jgi:hypothetical protein